MRVGLLWSPARVCIVSRPSHALPIHFTHIVALPSNQPTIQCPPTRGLAALEATVQPLAGNYCVGNAVTLADAALVPQLYNARRFQIDLAPFPTLLRIEAALAELPAFKQAHADAQPDAVVA